MPASFGAHRALPQGTRDYESARAALSAFLRARNARRLICPAYICTAIFDAARHAGVDVETYPLSENLQPATTLSLQDGDFVLLVDYFGLNASGIDEALASLDPARVIVDASQAWFAPTRPGVAATIRSPRKFLPVADGGVLNAEPLPPVEPADERAAHERIRYLLERIGAQPDATREAYLAAEAMLETISDRAMPFQTRAIIDALDKDAIASARRANFTRFEALLGDSNGWRWNLGQQVPLAYPFTIGRTDLRAHLIRKRLFTPRYWPGITVTEPVERRLLEETVFLPIDERYDEHDIARMADLTLETIKELS
ncbi:hypothetical protein [Sphingomicrobium aestuariivivum]|uniref:hypothetical protein n=1 Tax=Sphingomicrobium aestuariivivum TaxID=1582356 RepID=UPI001FD6CD3C|nr:hypothetical protein [Sphingomicrobium aestuariivivum]MCJ8191967.1 hypothetical protein [Sphingomicrobium aestuariivivum]